MKRGINFKVLIYSFLIVFAVSFIGSLFSSGNTQSSWYLDNKPDITPPNIVFPIVWTILYILIAIALYFLWVKTKNSNRKVVFWLFGVNLVANVLWSYLFFVLQNPLLSFIDILIILLTTLWLVLFSWKIERKSAWLLLPYLLWVAFASILNFSFLI